MAAAEVRATNTRNRKVAGTEVRSTDMRRRSLATRVPPKAVPVLSKAVLGLSLEALALAVLTLASCSGKEPTPNLQTPQPTATARGPQPTRTPTLGLTSVELQEGVAPGSWLVLGLVENLSDESRQRLQVHVELLNPAGELLAEVSVAPLIDSLPAGAESPFVAKFDLAGTPTSIRASASSRPAGNLLPAELSIELDQQFVTPAGELALIGFVTNEQAAPVELAGLGLLAVDSDARPRALAQERFGPSHLGAGERVPFLAIASSNPGHVAWHGYAGGWQSSASGGAPVESFAPAELRFTPQGAPFVVGELENTGPVAQNVNLLFTLRDADRVLTLGALQSPIPLESGSRLGYTAADFLGATLRGVRPQADDLSVELRLESVPADTETELLTTEVEVFLPVGSATLVRGSVTNHHQLTVDAAVVVEVRRLDGSLWTAGWTRLEQPLETGQTEAFVLELPSSEQLDLTTVELDLRAYGTRAGR